ncbi:hypothetical protein H072_7780 [Dactylellina haptotyla CBS 200.50]|uniref:Rhodopsin domain-containing protein n=1 Tax=Dactylellina haptotyla (strain CBS 200.50) TaxID=1284197 RepID=S8A6M1_DACHA|nr:hypothetical protein H072_7780 [Dactylellina haptotyla CBS 200.50]
MGISGGAAIAVEWAALAATFPFVGIRVFTRHRAGRLGLSDLIVSLTWLMFLISNTCDNELWRRGLYQDNLSWEDEWSEVIPDPATRMSALKIRFASYFPYLLELWGVKLSLLALYYTLITDQLPKLRLALHCVTGYTVATLIISIFLNLFWCVPISRNWSLEPQNRNTCSSSEVPYIVPVTFHISSDFALYLLPILFLKSMRRSLPRYQFSGILCLFGLGGLYIGVCIGRFITSGVEGRIPSLAVWTAFEMATGLMVICCPVLPIFNPRRKRSRGSIQIPSAQNDSSVDGADGGKDGETIRSWLSTRTRTASKTSDILYPTHRGSADNSDLEMDNQPVQYPSSTHRRSGRSSQHRFLPRISGSRESLAREPEPAYNPNAAASSTPPERRKPSRDGITYPPSEFKVEESLKQNNGNVQESVMALRDDILRSISFAYDESLYNHEHHTHAQPRKQSREGWR